MNNSHLPSGFVYINEFDPSLIIDLRYHGNDNFIGSKIQGYLSNMCIVSEPAATALIKAQEKFKNDGYGIVVYDAYRPQDAVDHFLMWSKDISDQKMKDFYYPRINKEKCFELGYIFKRSAHTRGSTLDISIIELGKSLHSIIPTKRLLLDGFEITYLDDGTVDMGSSFDLFDEASHFENNLISDEYKQRRTYLKTVMSEVGFNSYDKEWWHFTLKEEPFPDTYFNFRVK
jgi:D-alanyl-D-alanine dipeptidase